jgi:hypothetical protein
MIDTASRLDAGSAGADFRTTMVEPPTDRHWGEAFQQEGLRRLPSGHIILQYTIIQVIVLAL